MIKYCKTCLLPKTKSNIIFEKMIFAAYVKYKFHSLTLMNV